VTDSTKRDKICWNKASVSRMLISSGDARCVWGRPCVCGKLSRWR